MNKYIKNKILNGKQAYLNGVNAELFVKNYFLDQHYHILQQRFRCPYGEIDLITSKEDWLIFVEVKFRRHLNNAVLSLNFRQLTRLINTAEYFISEYGKSFTNIRFDLLAIDYQYKINHIKNITMLY